MKDISIPTPQAKPKHRRGAQPGNKNAQKHGLYSDFFTSTETEINLDNEPLQSEINMLRIACRRLFATIKPRTDPNEISDSLSALAHASASIARIMEAANRLGQNKDDWRTVFGSILNDFWKDQGYDSSTDKRIIDGTYLPQDDPSNPLYEPRENPP